VAKFLNVGSHSTVVILHDKQNTFNINWSYFKNMGNFKTVRLGTL